MAYDEDLAGRVREVLADHGPADERRMFGGLAFMVGGKMACGIVGERLMVRLGEEGADAALEQPHVAVMDFTGRPSRTTVYVEPAGTDDDAALRGWVERALGYVATLRER